MVYGNTIPFPPRLSPHERIFSRYSLFVQFQCAPKCIIFPRIPLLRIINKRTLRSVMQVPVPLPLPKIPRTYVAKWLIVFNNEYYTATMWSWSTLVSSSQLLDSGQGTWLPSTFASSMLLSWWFKLFPAAQCRCLLVNLSVQVLVMLSPLFHIWADLLRPHFLRTILCKDLRKFLPLRQYNRKLTAKFVLNKILAQYWNAARSSFPSTVPVKD